MPAKKSDQEERKGLGMRAAGAVRESPLLFVLAGIMIVVMVLATIYGLRYGKVDESGMRGHVSLYIGGENIARVDVDSDHSATIGYLGHTMHGKLVFDGADADSLLYVLQDISFENNLDPRGAVMMIRCPRSGLQGDLSGTWMLFFSYPDDGEVEGNVRSDWVFARADGTALYGYAPEMNAMTAQRKTLEQSSVAWRWSKTDEGLSLTN